MTKNIRMEKFWRSARGCISELISDTNELSEMAAQGE